LLKFELSLAKKQGLVVPILKKNFYLCTLKTWTWVERDRKVGHMHNLKGQVGGFGSNLPFCPPLTPLGMDVKSHDGN